jgi:hypothetical protein
MHSRTKAQAGSTITANFLVVIKMLLLGCFFYGHESVRGAEVVDIAGETFGLGAHEGIGVALSRLP